MCGRTALTASPEDLRDAFGLDEAPLELAPHYNLPPSSPLEVVRVVRGTTGRKLEELRWGLVPAWAKDPKIGHRLALARVETAATTAAFRDAFRWRRCLIAVDGFYEWRRESESGGESGDARGGERARRDGAIRGPRGKRKGPSTPFFIRRADHRPFALGGLWSRWVSADVEVVESCAIVTRSARPPVEAIHDRMPLVLEPDTWDRWLDPAITEAAAIAPLLEPRDHQLVAYSVSAWVNDPRHDDPACLEPAEPVVPAQRDLFLS
jgi:putative SOS response-associated peptidase YedK